MTRKLPLAVAAATGATLKNPARYRGQNHQDPAEPVGEPPDWLNEQQAKAWLDIAAEVPWLERPHRGILSIAAVLRARLAAGGDIGVGAMNLLRLCLGQMGASPTDAHRVSRPPAEGYDPAEEFFV